MIPDNKKVYFVNKKFLLGFIILFAVLIGYVLFKPLPNPVGSCAEMNLKGFTRVTPKNKSFNPALDKNHDGVEC